MSEETKDKLQQRQQPQQQQIDGGAAPNSIAGPDSAAADADPNDVDGADGADGQMSMSASRSGHNPLPRKFQEVGMTAEIECPNCGNKMRLEFAPPSIQNYTGCAMVAIEHCGPTRCNKCHLRFQPKVVGLNGFKIGFHIPAEQEKGCVLSAGLARQMEEAGVQDGNGRGSGNGSSSGGGRKRFMPIGRGSRGIQ